MDLDDIIFPLFFLLALFSFGVVLYLIFFVIIPWIDHLVYGELILPMVSR